jgi:hypothetical protein
MTMVERVKYYCFNRNCQSSLYNPESCIVVDVPLQRALNESIYCQECYEELVSKQTLELKLQINSILNGDKAYKL